MCLFLMATLGILMKISFTKQSIQTALSLGPIIEFQEVSDCCSCSDKWIGYQCNCYFFSTESSTWEESRHFCASRNASLFQLKNSGELGHFLNSIQTHFWIGMFYNKEHAAWLWEDGSVPSQDLFPTSQKISTNYCMMYSPSRSFLEEHCEKKNNFICKQQLI
nr:natural killer cells antigen CD94-like isoform X2 [Castor canadensis]